MDTYLLLLSELLVSILASLIVLRVLSHPLLRTLARICPDQESAEFWLSYTRVMLVIAPLMLVLLSSWLVKSGDPFDALRISLLAVFGGLLIAMQRLGNRLGHFVVLPAQKESGK
ncbi:MAG TPA: hypothetical protein VFW68_07305 [Rhodocyclaceae bacterium]|nr:hypothetical protein [Rhodocyclaceae bacterium]